MARYPKKSSPKLTKELIAEIASAIKTGAFVETAVAYCGISKDTFYRWLRDAKKKGASELHLELSDALARAFAESEVRDLLILDKIAMGIPETYVLAEDGSIALDEFGFPIVDKYKVEPNWKVSAWRLERRHPERWGKNAKGIRADLQYEEDESFSIEFIS